VLFRSELAAVVLGAAIFFTIFILGSGFGVATLGMVAAALGRSDEVQVRRDVRMGLWLSVLFGLLVLPVFLWSGPLLRALGQKPEVATLAQDYLRIVGWGMVPALAVMVLKSFLAALHRASVVLWVTLAAAVLNGVLNYALIFGNWGAPEMGVRGSALASLLAQILSVLVLCLYAARHPALTRFHLFVRLWRPDWPAFRQVFRLGLPIGLTGLAEGSLFNASAVMMGWIGTVELAAHGIAMEVAALAFMVHLGLSNAATVRIGRAWGERDGASLREAALVATGLSMLFGLVVVTVFLTLPRPVIGLFLDETVPGATAILDFGTTLLAVAAMFQIFDALQCMALGLLRGVHDTAVPMWLATFSYWGVGIPSSYVLAFVMGYGGVGLWLGMTVGLVVAAGLLMQRFWRGGAAALPALGG
jgi:MATE family multidrug resistance protein